MGTFLMDKVFFLLWRSDLRHPMHISTKTDTGFSDFILFPVKVWLNNYVFPARPYSQQMWLFKIITIITSTISHLFLQINNYIREQTNFHLFYSPLSKEVRYKVSTSPFPTNFLPCASNEIFSFILW